MQELVQRVHEAWGTQHCAHAHQQDVCPRNPDGPCTCVHSSPAEPDTDGPVLRACNGESDAVSTVSAPRWQSSDPPAVPAPPVSDDDLRSVPLSLSSQRLGDEVFRPPRTVPDARLT